MKRYVPLLVITALMALSAIGAGKASPTCAGGCPAPALPASR